MKRPSEEIYWTAKKWALETRIPYRTILRAAASGELAAIRPSGTAHGVILISESSWEAWIDRARLTVRVPAAIAPSLSRGRDGSLDDLALS